MTNVVMSGSEELFSKKYADLSICYYYYYLCAYCEKLFQLVEPDNNIQAGGAVRLIQYRNKFMNELVVENRAEGVCIDCCKEIVRRQQESD